MRAITLAMFVALGGCGGDADEPVRPDHWHTSGGAVRDREGRTVILRGVNLAGAHKAPPYFGFHRAEDFERVRAEWGMGVLRFLVVWSAIEPAPGAYDDDYLDAVAERMEWARAAGLSVVLDMHQDLYGVGFAGGDGAPAWTCAQEHYDAFEPTDPWFLGYTDEHMTACYDDFWASDELQAAYAEAWRRLAARLADNEAVIGFDPMNEPYWGSLAPGTFERERLTPFYERVVAAVRSAAPTWLAFVEPSSSRNLGVPTAVGPFVFPDAVYAPHSYDSAAESGEGFDPDKREVILANATALRAEADALGAPLWIGEYGGMAEAPGITEYMDAQFDGAAAARAGSAYWAYDRSDGYGLLDPDGNEKPALLDVVVRPYPERIAGELLAFGYDEATRTLTVQFEPDASIAAPTIVSLPERVYPDGHDLDCGGCSFVAGPGTLEVTAPAGSPVTIIVSP